MEISTNIWIWIAAIFTLFIYSFLYKDNPLYKFAEHVMVGLSTGYYTAIVFHTVIVPDFWEPLVHSFSKLGMTPAEFSSYAITNELTTLPTVLQNFSPFVAIIMLLIPALLGLMLFTRFIPKIAWLSRFSLAFYLGGFAGIAIPNSFQTRILDQLRGTIVEDHGAVVVPLFSIDAWRDFFSAPGIGTFFEAVSGPLLIIGTLCVLAYFFFSKEHKGVLGGAAKAGIWFLMIGFGASFGYTVMARVSLLIGRMQFLLTDWLGIID